MAAAPQLGMRHSLTLRLCCSPSAGAGQAGMARVGQAGNSGLGQCVVVDSARCAPAGIVGTKTECGALPGQDG